MTCKFEVYCFEWGKAEGAKRPRLFFAFRAKRPLHTGVRTGCHYSISLSVCITFVVVTDLRELYGDDFHKPGTYGSVRVWANAWDVFRRAPSRGGRGRRVAVDYVVCFGRGVFFLCVFCSVFFFSSTAHGLLQV